MLLAIVMVLGMLPGYAVTVRAAASDTVTLYFHNTPNWGKVNIFTWTEGMFELTGRWPGSEMEDLGNGIWSYDVPAEATMVIFNNGGTAQTNDLTIPADDSNLYDFSTQMWSVYEAAPDTPGPAACIVTVSADPAVGGTVSGGGSYEVNSSVTVSAAAAEGYTFAGWYVNSVMVETDAEYTFTVTENTDMTAVFAVDSGSTNPGTGSGENSDLSVFYGTRTDFRDESVYTLLISRFYDGDSGNNVHCWDDGMAGNPDSDPAWRGDFKGLIEKLDYIKALGFTAVRLNPVVQNASGYDYHGSHPINLKEIDFRLESDGYTYEDLIDACHARGLKVIQGVNLNSTSNFGEEYLRKLFDLNEEANWSSITESLIPTEKLLEQYPDYAELNPGAQYQARLDMLKAHITETLNADERYHREKQMGYETYLEQQGQIAGDCVDINTENPEVALYLAEICAWYARMGVDAVMIDDAKHINRWTFNEGILPLLNELLDQAGLELDIFCEIVSRARETWNRNIPSLSVPFYSWAETEEKWQDNWNPDHPTANIQTSIDHFNAHDTLEEYDVPTSYNALLDGITYHTPDYSRSNGMHQFDFTMMWNFENANNAFRAGVAGDKYMNDATWNLLSVDNWDYGPDGMEKNRYSLGVGAWKQNLNLMFTFRGIPSILYGSEIEFAKNLPIDIGPNAPLANTGRAYYGDHLEGSVTASEFGAYEADGTVANTLNSELSQHIRMLNELRQKIPALRKGQYTTDGNYVSGNIAFIRRYTDEDADIDSLALVTLTDGATFKNIPNGKYVDAVSGDVKSVTNGTLTVPAPTSTGLAVYVCCADGFTGLDAELSAAESVLRFNVDGDTTAVRAITTVNGKADLPAAPVLPDGYDFLGWIVNGEEYEPGETVAISVDSMARANLEKLVETPYPLWVGGEQFTSAKLEISGDSGTATYDPDNDTLTLNNYSYTGTGYNDAAIYYNGANTLKLNLVGDNSVTHSSDTGLSYGVYAESVSIEITGDKLTAAGGTINSGGYVNSQGIYVSNGNITIKSCTVIAAGDEVNGNRGDSCGIYAQGNITIESGTVTAIGDKVTIRAEGNSFGIGAYGDITITDSTVTATGSEEIGEGVSSEGIWAAYEITISGGEIIAKGKTAAFGKEPTITDNLVVYGADGIVIDTPDWNVLTYAHIKAFADPIASVTTADNETTYYTDLAEAIAAAKASKGSTLKLEQDITTAASSPVKIFGGSFTVDLNGKTWTFAGEGLHIRETADIILIDSSSDGTGKLLGSNNFSTLYLIDSAKLEIRSGTLEGNSFSLVDMAVFGDSASELTVSGGTLLANGSDSTAITARGALVKVTGGTIVSSSEDISCLKGKIDLSGHSNPTDITIKNGTGADVSVSADTILLPEGYVLLDDEGNTATTLMMDETYTVGVAPATHSVYVSTVDASNGAEIPGATMHLLEGQSKVIAEWESGCVPHTIEGLKAGVTYTLRAIVAPNGYTLPTDTTFSINTDGTLDNSSVTTIDKNGVLLIEFVKTAVKVSAVDQANGKDLAGAAMQIFDSEGIVVSEWTSNGAVEEIIGLYTGVEYIIHTDAAPDGYTIPNDVIFSIDEMGNVTTSGKIDEDDALLIEFAQTLVRVKAVDAEGAAIEGATLQILNAQNIVTAECNTASTDESVWEVLGLKVDEDYTLRVAVTPNGYETPGDIFFFLEKNGKVVYDGEPVTNNVLLLTFAETVPTITEVTFNSDSEVYDADTNTFYIDEKHPLVITVTGENLRDAEVTFYVVNSGGLGAMIPVIFDNDRSGSYTIDLSFYHSFLAKMKEYDTYEDIVRIGAGIDTLFVEDLIQLNVVEGIYDVELPIVDGCEVSTDKENPVMGDQVTITVTPDEGKEVDKVIVTDKNGEEVLVTKNENGTYTYEQPAGDVTITVELKVKTYTVKFVDWDDQELKSETVEHGNAATAPAEPTREGYTFADWDNEFDNVTSNLTVKAEYTVNQYTITFDTDDGSEVAPITQDYNTAVEKPADPTKVGYDFGGWYADAELTNAYVFNTMPAANITVYAKWNPAADTAYTVKHYHQNTSGSGYTLYESVTLYGTTNAETAAEANNYPGFTAQTFTQTTILSDGTAVVEIKYDRNTYTVTLVTNKGTIRDGNVTEYTYGVGATLPVNVTRSGHNFGGWYDNEDCKGTPVTEISTTDIGSKTFYAKWYFIYIPVVNPTYPPVVDSGDNGDVTVTPKNPEQGDTVTIMPDPDTGYEVDEVIVTDKNGNPVTVADNGDGTYSFKQPGSNVDIEVTFKDIVKACPGDKTCPMYDYTDLDITAWYHDGVHFCIANNLMTGTASDTFAPGMTTSRAMIVTILWRLAGEPVVNYAMSFEDVAADTWYTEAIRWAASEGIVNGYSDTAFGPNDNITREQLAAILYRYEQSKGGGFTGAWMIRMDYVDLADVSDWAYEAMCWMNMNGIVNGKPGKVLDPKGSAARAEAATMLYRYCEVSSKKDN